MDRDLVFISYSRDDSEWALRLKKHLKPFVRAGMKVWEDSQIRPGDDWRHAIELALARAKVAVLLVSHSYLASDFIADNELPPLLDAAKQRGVRIFWIPIGDSAYNMTPIARYQAAHNPRQPLDTLTSAEADGVLTRVCTSIYSTLHP